jgi:hypothetical protein
MLATNRVSLLFYFNHAKIHGIHTKTRIGVVGVNTNNKLGQNSNPEINATNLIHFITYFVIQTLLNHSGVNTNVGSGVG